MRTDFKIGLAIGLFIIVGMGLYFVFTSGSKNTKTPDQPVAEVKDRHGERPHTSIKGDPTLAKADAGQPKPADHPKTTDPTGSGTAAANNKPANNTVPSNEDPWKLTNNTNPSKPADSGSPTISSNTPSPTPKSTDSGTTPSGSITAKTPSDPSGEGFLKSGSTEKKPDLSKSTMTMIDEPKTDLARDTAKPEQPKATGTTSDPSKTPAGTGSSKASSTDDTSYQVKPSGPRATTPTPTQTNGPKIDLSNITKSGTTPGATATATQQETTYVVQSGDNGFWGISQKVYGDGKYHDLIAQANQGVDALHLRPGQKIKVPPLPTSTNAGSTPGAVASNQQHGTVVAGADGKKYYVVKSGDQGFWGIAEKQYGNGKYASLIQKANPDADPHALKIGQKLLMPEKPTETAVAGNTTTGGGTTTAAPAGSTTYVVKEEDNRGLWGIAEKEYGNGQLWTLIQNANNNIDASKLRPGMKLVIPPASSAERTASGGTPATAEPTRHTAPSSGGGTPAAPPAGVIRDPDTPVF